MPLLELDGMDQGADVHGLDIPNAQGMCQSLDFFQPHLLAYRTDPGVFFRALAPTGSESIIRSASSQSCTGSPPENPRCRARK